MAPAVAPLVDAAANLRRAVIVGSGLALVSTIVLAFYGHVLMGIFAAVGLGLGALNNSLLQKSIRQYAADPTMNKKRFRHGVMGRLGSVTLLALAAGLLLRPDGLGVFAGLAVFQILMLVGAAVPVFRSLRPSA